MTFTSLVFILFFVVFYLSYWLLNSYAPKWMNLLLLIGSYIFYGYWDLRFLFLIAVSSLSDFLLAKLIFKTTSAHKKKGMLLISLIINLGILACFKYYNFFITSLNDITGLENMNLYLLNVVLPVGISFYTFQTLSYTIDVYKDKIRPERDIVIFLAYVSFFPQLVAGPIERASRMLPQFTFPKVRNSDDFRKGLDLILWGLFSKIVIADGAGIIVDDVFSDVENNGFLMLILGAILFSIQIYGDFSGYSKMARGIAKWLGFELMQNFDKPYFALSFSEFWSRWHISLSSWFRDYVYIPLGGNRVMTARHFRNVFIVFLLSGMWHGANWTFIIWGGLHGVLLILEIILRKFVVKKFNLTLGYRILWRIAFLLIIIMTWVVFRAENVAAILEFFYSMVSNNILDGFGLNMTKLTVVLILSMVFLLLEYWSGDIETPLDRATQGRSHLLLVTFLVFLIYNFGIFETTSFLYFQF